MKKLLLLLFFISTTCFSQDIEFEEFSYSEFFQMMEDSKDSVFTYENAIISFNPETDSAFINDLNDGLFTYSIQKNAPQRTIKPEIRLTNVHFLEQMDGLSNMISKGVLQHYVFEKKVRLRHCGEITFNQCTFKAGIEAVANGPGLQHAIKAYPNLDGIKIVNSTFYDASRFFPSFYPGDNITRLILSLRNNIFYLNDKEDESFGRNVFIYGRGTFNNVFEDNQLYGKGRIFFVSENNQLTSFTNNQLDSVIAEVIITDLIGINQLTITKNAFGPYVQLAIDELSAKYKIGWDQFAGKLISNQDFGEYGSRFENIPFNDENLLAPYFDSIRVVDQEVYRGENAIRGILYNHYTATFDHENKNAVYVEIKNLETERLKYLYDTNPNFDNFFTLQINRFLKAFSLYGTRPARAIIFSVYVILAFALIYLFFPNSWDKHGKNRIMNRYRFFTKYMNQDAGMHDVYLEEQRKELLEAEDFKAYMENAEKYIPRFFIATAMPLYKWAVSGTRLSASLLKRVDIMKGTWQDLPPHQRFWKSVLLIGAFIISVLYDLLIKILNAVMLSINTFTTLGFGEIPIKGLPRYLAIIQGFIGWFMLTIFSVSLISQLLN
ncbi:ion channel [Algoriphagus namhaensis]|uniref:Ion channel n=1 Tax=Algoriphagus namhaensis TaxID=915353 RepID=A0ABV8AR41_9BACT